jgi:DNA-binding NarL/FixJ family response regulator
MNLEQCVEARRQIDRALVQLNELAKRIPREEEHLSKGKRTAILELAAQGLSCRQIARVMGISPQKVRRVVGVELVRSTPNRAPREGRTLPAADPRTLEQLQEEPAAFGPRRSNCKPIRILTVDDHPLLRQGIAGLIADEPDMTLVAKAANGREAIEQFRRHRPDITLMDLQMPEMNGLDAMTAIGEFPDARIIVDECYAGRTRRRPGAAGSWGLVGRCTALRVEADRDSPSRQLSISGLRHRTPPISSQAVGS